MVTTLRELIARKRVVQIAGAIDPAEARAIVDCGADLVGFPLGGGCGPGNAGETEARVIVAGIRPPVFAVAITYIGNADGVAALCRGVGAAAVQIHGSIETAELQRLRALSPDLFVIKTLAVRGGDFDRLAGEADHFFPFVDAFLTDTFDPVTGRWGATGKAHDWSVSRRIVDYTGRPVILAGGLTPENVARAIAEVRPAGVDAHTGLEDASGRKDPDLMKRFVTEARRAFASL